jgi:hypothetical protein
VILILSTVPGILTMAEFVPKTIVSLLSTVAPAPMATELETGLKTQETLAL